MNILCSLAGHSDWRQGETLEHGNKSGNNLNTFECFGGRIMHSERN